MSKILDTDYKSAVKKEEVVLPVMQDLIQQAEPQNEPLLPVMQDLIQQDPVQQDPVQQEGYSYVDLGWVMDALMTQSKDKSEAKGILAEHGATKELKEYEKELEKTPGFKFNAKNREKNRREKLRNKFERQNPGLLEKRALLFEPAINLCQEFGSYVDEMRAENQEQTATKLADAFQGCLKNKQTLDAKSILIGEEQQEETFGRLCNIFEQLQNKKNEELSPTDAATLIREYQALKPGFTAGTASSEKMLLATTQYTYTITEQKDRAPNVFLSTLDPKTCYLLLYHCTAVALRNYGDGLSPAEVNMEAFGKLCGLAQLAEVAASHVCTEKAFMQERAQKCAELEDVVRIQELAKEEAERIRLRAEEEKKRIAEEAEKLRREKLTIKRRKMIMTAVSADGNQSVKWLLEEDYVKLLENHLGERMYKKDEQGQKPFQHALREKLLVLNARLGELALNVKNCSDKHLGMPMLEERQRVIVYKNSNQDRLFSEISVTEKEVRDLLENKMNNLEDPVEQYREKQEKFVKLFENASVDKEGIKGFGALSQEIKEKLWQEESVQNMILDTKKEMTQKAFESVVKGYVEQAENAMLLITRAVQNNVAPYVQSVAIEEIKNKLGAACLIEASTKLKKSIGSCLNKRDMDMPMTFELDQSITEAAKTYKLSEKGTNHLDAYFVYTNFTQEVMNEKTAEKRKAVCNKYVRKLASLLSENEAILKDEMSKKLWTQSQFDTLHLWSAQNIYKPDYKTRMLVKTEAVNTLVEKSDSKKYEMNYDEYLKLHMAEVVKKTQQTAMAADLAKQKVQNVKAWYEEKLRGDDVCKWADFKGKLEGYEDVLINSIEDILKEKKWATDLPGMKNVDNLSSLSNLTVTQYQAFCEKLRSNLAEVMDQWSEVSATDVKKLKTHLLPQMLRGEIAWDTFSTAVQNSEEVLGRRESAQKMKLYLHLSGVKEKKTNKTLYPFNQRTKADSSQKAPEKRAIRLDYASQVWKILRDKGCEKDVFPMLLEQLRIVQKQYESTPEKSADAVAVLRENLRTYFDIDVEKETTKAKKLPQQDQQKEIKMIQLRKEVWNAFTEVNNKATKENGGTAIYKGRKGFMAEFMLCGLEKQIFETQDGVNDQKRAQARTAFLTGTDNEYNTTLYDFMRPCLNGAYTASVTMASLAEQNLSHLNKKEQALMLDRVRTLAEDMMLEITEDQDTPAQREKNKARFGIENWSEYKEFVLRIYNVKQNENNTLSSPLKQTEMELAEEMPKAAALYRRRKKEMTEYKGGLLSFLSEKIEASDEGWCCMMLRGDDAFLQYLADVEKKARPALKAMEQGESKVVAKRFAAEYGNQMISGKGLSATYWKELYTSYEHTMLEKKIGDLSIRERFEEAERNFKDFEAPMPDAHVSDARVMTREELTGVKLVEKYLLDNEKAFQTIFNEKNLLDLVREQVKVATYITRVYDTNKDYQKFPPEAKADVIRRVDEERIHYVAKENMVAKSMNAIIVTVGKAVDAGVYAERKARETAHQSMLTRVADRKQKGRTADSENQKQLEVLRKQLWQVGSPIMVAANVEKPVEENELKDAQALAKRVCEPTTPEVIRNILAEDVLVLRAKSTRLLDKITNPTGLDEIEWRVKQLTHTKQWLEKVYANMEKMEQLTPASKQAFLYYVYIKADREKAVTRNELTKYFNSFNTTGKKVEKAKKLYHQAAHPELKAEYKDYASCIAMAAYTMNSDDFERFSSSREDYFESLNEAYVVFENALADVAEENRERYRKELRGYFHEDILRRRPLSSLNKVEFEQDVKEVLENKELKRYVFGYSTKQSKAQAEQGPVAATRITMESFLAASASAEELQEYSKLTVEQRQVFALVLTLPTQFLVNDSLGSAKMMAEQIQMDKSASKAVQKQLAAYVAHEDFAPEIDYAAATEKMRTRKNQLNERVFGDALALTKFCVAQWQDNIPKDMERMSNGHASIQAAALLSTQSEIPAGVKAVCPSYIEDKEDFIKTLKEMSNKDEEQLDNWWDKLTFNKWTFSSVKDKLAHLDDSQYDLLIRVLQDRTMLDYTTGMGSVERVNGSIHGVVNVGQREEVMAQYVENEGAFSVQMNTMTSYTKAMKSLFSYQLRDDVNFLGRGLQQEDFAEGALNRKTLIDWPLLGRALDFVNEAQRENRRLTAVKTATKYVGLNLNIPSNELYQTVKDNLIEKDKSLATLTEKQFVEYLESQAVIDNENSMNPEGMMIGFNGLSEEEKQLFYRALESRDLLDVSKNNEYRSFFGLDDRDFVNAHERNQLTDTYVQNSLIAGKRLEHKPDECGKAFMSLLSAQMNDSVDYMNPENMKESVVVNKNLIYDRTTAIDWALFAKALQFVKRATNEERILKQDRSLYYGVGEAKSGEFEVNTDFMRDNLYKSGNRFTRFYGRKMVDYVKEQIPSSLQNIALGLVSVEAANYLNKTGLLVAGEEEAEAVPQNFLEKLADGADDALDTLISYTESVIDNANMLEKVGSKGLNMLKGGDEQAKEPEAVEEEEEEALVEKVDKFLEDYGTAIFEEEHLKNIRKHSRQVYNTVSAAKVATESFMEAVAFVKKVGGNIGRLNEKQQADQKAEKAKKGDEQLLKNNLADKTEEDKKLIYASVLRNQLSSKLASTQVDSAIQEEIITDIAEYTVSWVEKTGVVEDIASTVKEALDFAFFIKQYFADRANVKAYIDNEGSIIKDVEKIKRTHESTNTFLVNKRLKNASNSEVVQTVYGFASFDELSDFVGRNIVHSLLFSASEQNPLRNTRICARAALTALDMKDVIGKQDRDSAMQVFNVITGQKYK